MKELFENITNLVVMLNLMCLVWIIKMIGVGFIFVAKLIAKTYTKTDSRGDKNEL